MLLLSIDEKSGKAKYLQIIEQIKEKVDNQSILPGDRLPSTRKMAQLLDVHRTTVAGAYQELWAMGYIDLKPGACPRVRKRMKPKDCNEKDCKSLVDWNEAASQESKEVYNAYVNSTARSIASEGAEMIDLSSLDIDRRLFPVESFRLCMSNAMKSYGAELLGYGNPSGFLPLKDSLTKRLKSHGIYAANSELLITNGVQQGIDLILRMLAEPGRAVVVESPTYKELIPLLRYYGLRVFEAPMLESGLDLDALEHILEKERPAFIYTMPSFHNPTGISTNQEHRERLLSIAEVYRVPIIEDGFEEEMKYFGKAVLPIKSMDKNNLVLYCGTFSKVLFPGVRIGWVVAERECIERLTVLRRCSDLSSSMVLQAAVHEFCEQGYYDRHISLMHRIYRKRMQRAVSMLRESISKDWAEWVEPNGGYLIWLKLKNKNSVDFERVLHEHGVYVMTGNCFFYSTTSEVYIRISISSLNELEIAEGIQRLSKALKKINTTF